VLRILVWNKIPFDDMEKDVRGQTYEWQLYWFKARFYAVRDLIKNGVAQDEMEKKDGIGVG
jgi:hypothetical protein